MEMVGLVDKARIVRLHLEGWPRRRIADEVGVCRNTVDKYVREYEALRERLEACSPDDVDAAREIAAAMAAAPECDSSSRGDRKRAPEMEAALREALADEEEKRARPGPSNKQMLTKAQVHQILVSQGFEISEGTVRKRINELTRRPAEAFVARQYEFGERFEHDFGEVRLEVAGRIRKYYLAVMCRPASDYRFALPCENQGKGVFLDSQVRFFEHMGGRFREGVYDNMRSVVSEFVGRSEKELNPDLVSLAAHYGFRVNVTNCFSGREKGAVERSVGIVRRAAFAVEWRLASAAQARARLEAALAELNAGKGALGGHKDCTILPIGAAVGDAQVDRDVGAGRGDHGEVGAGLDVGVVEEHRDAPALLHREHDLLLVVVALHNGGKEALMFAGRHKRPVEAGAHGLLPEDDGLLAKVAEKKLLALCQGMALREVCDHAPPHDGAPLHAVAARQLAVGGHGDVDVARAEVVRQIAQQPLADVYMHLRIRGAHTAAQLPGYIEVPKQAVEPYGHRAAYGGGVLGLHPALRQCDLLEYDGAQLEGRFAFGGELEVQRGALYEAAAQLFFEMTYAPAHGRLRQKEPLGRLGKAALRRHLDEAGKMVQVQHGRSSRRRCGFWVWLRV